MKQFKYDYKRSAGSYRHRLTVQQKQSIKDDEGMVTQSWVDYVTIWSAREPLAQDPANTFKSAAVQAEKSVRYRIRYHPGITPDMRVVCDGRTYEVTVVLDDVYGDRTETHIITQEVQNG